MATRAAEITNVAYTALVNCRPTHKLVADLAERYGLSHRQARRYVEKGYRLLKGDLAEIDLQRPEYLCRMICALEHAMEQGVRDGHGHVVIGAVNSLSRLLGIGSDAPSRNPYDTRR